MPHRPRAKYTSKVPAEADNGTCAALLHSYAGSYAAKVTLFHQVMICRSRTVAHYRALGSLGEPFPHDEIKCGVFHTFALWDLPLAALSFTGSVAPIVWNDITPTAHPGAWPVCPQSERFSFRRNREPSLCFT